MLERDFERVAANLDEVHALGAGEHLLQESESAGGAYDLAEGVRDRDGHALGAFDDDVVVGRPVHGDCGEAGLFNWQRNRGRRAQFERCGGTHHGGAGRTMARAGGAANAGAGRSHDRVGRLVDDGA